MSTYDLVEHFRYTRQQSLAACEPLAPDDFGLQADAFASPPKWHLAHTTWFFETFLLRPFASGYQSPFKQFDVLFNSYYNGVGEQFARDRRGLLSRPTVAEVIHYREFIEEQLLALLSQEQHAQRGIIVARTRLGIEHEQQHQELFFTDLKYSLSFNPLYPVYATSRDSGAAAVPVALRWCSFEGGLVNIGAASGDGADAHASASAFAFDNERPRHRVYLQPFALANRLVTNAEFRAFIDDGGYQCPDYWLSDGWAEVQRQGWQRPLYWRDHDGELQEYTLHGLRPWCAEQAVCHISGYEADAYASWADSRLPTEAEWEYAAAAQAERGGEGGKLHPCAAAADGSGPLQQLTGDCWQWTGSAYRPYPGFTAAPGAIGEYNGKFMCNQWVLRGGSCVSSPGHVRPSYRNFFYPADRWQFSGLRLARDL